MKKIIPILSIFFMMSCERTVNKEQGANGSETVYEASTNLGTSIYKYKVDSIVYLVAVRRGGIAIIKHGVVESK